jgi:hypothetical protein
MWVPVPGPPRWRQSSVARREPAIVRTRGQQAERAVVMCRQPAHPRAALPRSHRPAARHAPFTPREHDLHRPVDRAGQGRNTPEHRRQRNHNQLPPPEIYAKSRPLRTQQPPCPPNADAWPGNEPRVRPPVTRVRGQLPQQSTEGNMAPRLLRPPRASQPIRATAAVERLTIDTIRGLGTDKAELALHTKRDALHRLDHGLGGPSFAGTPETAGQSCWDGAPEII